MTIATFLKTGRSKHATAVLAVQNLDNFKKEVIYDILSNIHYYGYVRTNKEGSAYYKTEPFKSQYERIMAINSC